MNDMESCNADTVTWGKSAEQQYLLFLLTLCFWPGHTCHDAHRGLDSCCPWPALTPHGQSCSFGEKNTTHHTNSLPETECGICSTKEAASNILAELSSMLLHSLTTLWGKRFPNNFSFSCWNLAWGALHFRTCRRPAQLLLLASVFAVNPWLRSPTIPLLEVFKKWWKKKKHWWSLCPAASSTVCSRYNICFQDNKNCGVKHGGRLNLVPGYMEQVDPRLWKPINIR